nr:NADPH--cytochrome P450 reductase-like [Tanacetum cinerariifolium]
MHLKKALTCYTDLLNAPKKLALLALAAHASDPKEADRLKFLASCDGKYVYAKWIFLSKRILLDILEAFPLVKPPLGIFFAAVAIHLQSQLHFIPSSPKCLCRAIVWCLQNLLDIPNQKVFLHSGNYGVKDTQIGRSHLNIIIVGYLIVEISGR